ncbi:hypothetical protein T484DRAFT_1876790, partial [Baffinella frigidus]
MAGRGGDDGSRFREAAAAGSKKEGISRTPLLTPEQTSSQPDVARSAPAAGAARPKMARESLFATPQLRNERTWEALDSQSVDKVVARLHTVRSTMREHSDSNEALLSAIGSLMHESKAVSAQGIQAAREEAHNLRVETEHLRVELRRSQTIIVSLRSDSSTLQQTIVELREQMSVTQSSLEGAVASNEELRASLEASRAELLEARGGHERELEGMCRDLNARERRLEVADAAAKTLRASLEESRMAGEAASKQADVCKSDSERNWAALQVCRRTGAAKDAQLASMREEYLAALHHLEKLRLAIFPRASPGRARLSTEPPLKSMARSASETLFRSADSSSLSSSLLVQAGDAREAGLELSRPGSAQSLGGMLSGGRAPFRASSPSLFYRLNPLNGLVGGNTAAGSLWLAGRLSSFPHGTPGSAAARTGILVVLPDGRRARARAGDAVRVSLAGGGEVDVA